MKFSPLTSNKDVNNYETKINPFRILVADDDDAMLDSFRQILSPVETGGNRQSNTRRSKEDPCFQRTPNLPSSFDIQTCTQANEAVEAVKDSLKCGRPFSMAFIDVRMPPGPDGVWAAEHIRKLDPEIEIVIMTGYTDIHPDVIAGRVPPAHKLLYVQKPFQSHEIFQFAYTLSMKWYTEKKMEEKEKDLIEHKLNVEKLNKEMIETNRALSVLARNIDKNKEVFEKRIYETCTVKLLPIIKDLKNNKNCQRIMADLDVLETNLSSLFSACNNHHEIINYLTDQEMRVAALIKRGLTSQKISNLLCISEHTVKTHRKNIRKKLNIKNSNVNLSSYLKSNMPSDLISDHQATAHDLN